MPRFGVAPDPLGCPAPGWASRMEWAARFCCGSRGIPCGPWCLALRELLALRCHALASPRQLLVLLFNIFLNRLADGGMKSMFVKLQITAG